MTETRTASSEGRSFVELTLLVVAWSLVGWFAWHLVEASSSAQWDLSVYRRAGTTFRSGADPYVTPPNGLPFVYPPIVLPLLGWLSRVPAAMAYWSWLAAKAVCLFLCLLVARRHFAPFRHHYASVLFLVFAFNGALFTDVIAGNVTVFEQALFWCGVSALLRGRYAVAVLLIVLGAQLKLTPFVLLVLVPALLPRRQWGWAFGGAALMMAAMTLQWLVWPELTGSFIREVRALNENGQLNPSSYAVAGELSRLLADADPLWASGGPVLYALFVCAVLAFGATTLYSHREWLRAHPAWCVSFVVCAYVLVLPRFKDYSYVMLLIPAWYALQNLQLKRLAWLPLLLALPEPKTFLSTGALTDRVIEYVPWLATATLFVLIGQHVRDSATGDRAHPPSPIAT